MPCSWTFSTSLKDMEVFRQAPTKWFFMVYKIKKPWALLLPTAEDQENTHSIHGQTPPVKIKKEAQPGLNANIYHDGSFKQNISF